MPRKTLNMDFTDPEVCLVIDYLRETSGRSPKTAIGHALVRAYWPAAMEHRSSSPDEIQKAAAIVRQQLRDAIAELDRLEMRVCDSRGK